MRLNSLPLSQTVTPSRTPSPSSVTYFMDGPLMTDIKLCFVTHNPDTPLPVTNCHTFSDPSLLLESDVLLGRPLSLPVIAGCAHLFMQNATTVSRVPPMKTPSATPIATTTRIPARVIQ